MSVILTLRHPDRRSLLSYDLDDAVLGTHPSGGDPNPLLRRSAVQNSKCRLWCRLRGNASLISSLKWTEDGLKAFLDVTEKGARHSVFP